MERFDYVFRSKILDVEVVDQVKPLTRVFTYQEMENAVTSYLCEAADIHYFPEKIVYQIFIV